VSHSKDSNLQEQKYFNPDISNVQLHFKEYSTQ